MMTKFFFDVKGPMPTRDFVGLDFSRDVDAILHGAMMAADIRKIRSWIVPGECISVCDENGFELHVEPIKPPHLH